MPKFLALLIGTFTSVSRQTLGRVNSDFDFLTNTGEMFDGSKTFIFGSPNGQVHVLCEFRDDSFLSALCSLQTFRTTADAYIHWFDEQVRTVGPPYFPINPFDLNEKVPDNQNG